MADRATLLADLFTRNALRLAHGLPHLDIRAELEHAAALEDMRTVNTMAEKYPDELQRIQQQVKDDLLAQHGAEFFTTMAARFTINREVQIQFDHFLRTVANIERGPPQPRHPIVYGGSEGNSDR